MIRRDPVQRHEADIVPVPGILAARIAKAHKEFHRIRLFKSGSIRWVPGQECAGQRAGARGHRGGARTLTPLSP